MTSASERLRRTVARAAVAATLVVAAPLAAAAPVRPELPCDRPVALYGASTLQGVGVSVGGANDVVARTRTFFARVCRAKVEVSVDVDEHARLLERVDEIVDAIGTARPSVAFVHFPIGDVAAGASVDAMLRAYRRLLDACGRAGTACVIGGQQPAADLSDEASARQVELERRAAQALGRHYLPIYDTFRSEWPGRRLMLPADSGDGRHLNDRGHEMLFNVFRLRLLELTGSTR